MRAITVQPGIKDSARLEEAPEPPVSAGSILVRSIALGICGTDREIVAGLYGEAPAGQQRLILGHESLGRVVEAPGDSGFAPGDLLVGIVRHPDPVPCAACAAGEWDMCRNGQYTEHGIKGLHGFGAEYFRVDPEFAVPVDASLGLAGVLIEPTSVVAKAWDHIARIAARAVWRPFRVLVTGAGPIGLLAALLGRQRGFEVHVLDRMVDGPKPELVKALGAQYHTESLDALCREADIVVECTGAGRLVWEVMTTAGAAGGIVCLTGVSSTGSKSGIDLG